MNQVNDVQIDYVNLQFMVFNNGKLLDNPLPVEVQRAVILKILQEVAECIRTQIIHGLSDDPPGLKEHLLD